MALLTGFIWPRQNGGYGAWVDTNTAPDEALRGCRVRDFPYWLDDELWNVELGGAIEEREHLLLAERARLLDRIDAWDDAAAWAFVSACAERVAERAAAALRDDGRSDAAASIAGARDLEELERAATAVTDHSPASAQLTGYVADICFYARDAGNAARAAGVAAKMAAYALAGEVVGDLMQAERLAQERAWQAAWLADRLELARPD